MKKLLLVLLVVTLASFLLVGCLGEGTLSNDDPDDDDVVVPVETELTVTVADSYLDPDGTFYVKGSASNLVTVTFPESIADDYVVWIGADTTMAVPGDKATVTAATDRKIWTKAFDFSGYDECEEACLVIIVSHVCCPDDPIETYYTFVTSDSLAPKLSLDITFEDCECDDPGGMSFTFAPATYEDTSDCSTPTCCDDACSGEYEWSISDAATCLECVTLPGTGCPDDTYECDCLLYATTANGEETYTFDFTFTDKVGNKIVDEWTIVLDTDSVISFANTNTATVDDGELESDQKVNIPYTPCDENF